MTLRIFSSTPSTPAAVLACCLFFSRAVVATTVTPLDLPDLVEKADLIADATVTNSEVYLAPANGNNSIHTRVTFTLNAAPLKGQVSSPFTLNFLGGTLGSKRLVVGGMPQLNVGQRVILFTHTPNATYVSPIIGFNQGILKVVHDDQSNTDRVFRWSGAAVNESTPFISKPASGSNTQAEAAANAETVDHFMQRVKQLVNP